MADRAALDRVVGQVGGPDVLDRLVGLSGADLTTLLLGVLRERTAVRTPADVWRQQVVDRFVAPAAVPFDRLRWAEDLLLSLLPAGFLPVTPAPVVPLGTHSVLGTVHQDTVLTTVRGTEVAADVTNGLALLAAQRRRELSAGRPRSAEVVRLAGVQRVVRAQRVRGAGRFAHFGLFGAVTAGRDTGDLAFELEHVVEHARFLMAVAGAIGEGGELRLTVADPRLAPVGAAVRDALPAGTVVDDPDRRAGVGYYAGLCFKAFTVRSGGPAEIGDGGLLDWTARLLGNRKERLVTSGIGVEAVAAADE